jgi:predicted nucleic acid-binding protein
VNFVLDTNAVSEMTKSRPNSAFAAWRDTQDPMHLFITTISIAEVWNGFHRLQPSHDDYNRIKLFATELPLTYRVLNFDLRSAAIWGELTATATSLCHCATPS